MAAQPNPKGEPYRWDTQQLACPDCGVVQKVDVMAQKYEDNPTQMYVDSECAVCGFDDVWT